MGVHLICQRASGQDSVVSCWIVCSRCAQTAVLCWCLFCYRSSKLHLSFPKMQKNKHRTIETVSLRTDGLDIEELMCYLRVGVLYFCQAYWSSSKRLLVFVTDCTNRLEHSLANWNRAAMASSHHWESWVMWLISNNPNRKISWPTVRATVAIRLHARIMSNWTVNRKEKILLLNGF